MGTASLNRENELDDDPQQCSLTKNDIFLLKSLIQEIIFNEAIIVETGQDNTALNVGKLSPIQQFVLLVLHIWLDIM